MQDFQSDLDETAKHWVVTFRGVTPMYLEPYWVCELMDCEPCISNGIGEANVVSHFEGQGKTLELAYRDACINQERNYTRDEMVREMKWWKNSQNSQE